MSLIWLILGALTFGAIWGLLNWNTKRKPKLSKLQLSGMLFSILIALFAFAWSISSIYEAEFQAAAMGIMIFGGIAVIIFLLSLKLEDFKGFSAKDKAIPIIENKDANL